MKPLLLVDIDGVLCPYKRTYQNQNWEKLVLREGHDVWVNRENISHLKELSTHFDLVWATMWQDEANKKLGPWHELETLEYIEFVKTPWEGKYNSEIITFIEVSDGGTYKLPSIKKYVGNKPFAWIDDEIGEDALQWANSRDTIVPTRLHKIDGTVGLTTHDVKELIEFANDAVARWPFISDPLIIGDNNDTRRTRIT